MGDMIEAEADYREAMERYRKKDFTGAWLSFERAAREGHPGAMYSLGMMYGKGLGEPRDSIKGMRYIQAAARLGYQPALDFLKNAKEKAVQRGPLETEGLKAFFEKDYVTALEKFEQAAAQEKSAEAAYRAADLHDRGLGTKTDPARAFLTYGEAARLGNPMAQFWYGFMYTFGLGCAKDREEGRKWLEKTVPKIPAAQVILEENMLDGKSIDDPVPLVDPTALSQGDAEAEYNYGRMYSNIRFRFLSFSRMAPVAERERYWYERAAGKGHLEAQYRCGLQYDHSGAIKEDPVKAVYWFKQAAEQGHAEAQYRLGSSYKYGRGTEEDLTQTLYWYEKAAEQGERTVQRFCAEMYDKGEGTPVNKAKALYWYEKAAEQGDKEAQFNCGRMYYNGEGTARDKWRAKVWFEKSAAQGYADAQRVLREYF